MDPVTFPCRNCGATLDVPQNAIIVTCKYCKGQHKIGYSDGAITAELIRRVETQEGQLLELDRRIAAQPRVIARAIEIRSRLKDIDLAKQMSVRARTMTEKAEKNSIAKQAVEIGVRGYGEEARKDVEWMMESNAGVAMTGQAVAVGCGGLVVGALVFATIMNQVSKSSRGDCVGIVLISGVVMLIICVILAIAVKGLNWFSSKSRDEEVGGRLRVIERELAAELARLEKGVGKEHKMDVNNESSGIDQAGRDQRTSTAGIEVGRTYSGLVTKVLGFGVFVELGPGLEGMCLVSELDDKYVQNVRDVVKVGDILEFMVMAVDGEDRIRLSRKAALREKHDETR